MQELQISPKVMTYVMAAIIFLLAAWIVWETELLEGVFPMSSKGGESCCGKSTVTDPSIGASAKDASFLPHQNQQGVDMAYSDVAGDWSLDVSEDATKKHVEFVQNEDQLTQAYNWEADEETNKRFDSAAPDKIKAMKAATVRPFSFTTHEPPRNSKTLGSPGLTVMLSRSHAFNNDVPKLKFGDTQPEWGLSDAYVSARAHDGHS